MTGRRLVRAAALLVALGVLAALAAGRWLIVERPVHDPDAILVLASHESERLPRAWQLALDHPRATVVLSYPAEPTPFNCQDCAHRVERLESWGLPRARVLVMGAPVRNSHDEILAFVAVARTEGWASVQIVTSPYHTRRVAGLVHHFAESSPLRVGVTGASLEPVWPSVWWSRRYDGRYVLYEVAALAANGWRYGIWPWEWWAA